jgi:anti-sigma regulatory factor (Ser/Thr protein kinase)
LNPAQQTQSLTLVADPHALQDMRHWLESALAAYELGCELRSQLVLAVNEACMNIIQHAYGDATPGEIRLRMTLQPERLVFDLEDDAPCIDPAKVKPRALADVRPGGLGVHFIREIMDVMAFLPCQGRGNRLHLVKYLDRTCGRSQGPGKELK